MKPAASSWRSIALGLIVSLFLGAAIAAGSAEIGPRWSELTPAQRGLLAPLEREWPRLDDRNKQKWVGVAERLPTMPAPERERIQARMAEWANLTPQQRGQMRLRYQEARQEAPRSRQDRWAAYQALPPEEREKLAARGNHASRAAASAAGTGRRRGGPSDAAVVIRQPVAPAVVQAQPGATTSLMSRGNAVVPSHITPGWPRLMASPERVDSVTLLPRRAASRPGP